MWLGLNIPYYTQIMRDHIKIGCQLQEVSAWESLTEAQAEAMDGRKAVEFMKEYLPMILGVHKSLNMGATK